MPVNPLRDPTRPRGRPPQLTREAVLDAAMTRLDAAGAEAVTFRALARDLGVSPMTLYGHVTDKDELLLALVDRLADRLTHPPLPTDPRSAIMMRWQTLYDGLAEHPWLPEVLARRRLMASSVLGAVEDIHAALVRAGMTLEQAIRGYRIMWEFTLGALLVRAGARAPSGPVSGPAGGPMGGPVGGPVSGPTPAPSVQAKLRGAPDPARYPTLAASAPTWRAIEGRDTYPADLGTLLDGLLAGAARVAAPGAPDNPEASA
jgi:AcrR family transcriptional regulator